MTQLQPYSTPVPALPGDLMGAWLASMDVAEDTRRTYHNGVTCFRAWLEANQPEAVTPAVIRAWRDSMDGAAATVNLRLTAVRRFYDWLAEQGHVAGNPAAGVKGRKRRGTSRSHQRDELAGSEVLAVLDACDATSQLGARDRAILSLMAYCALRTVEVHRANLDDLRTKDGRLVLFVQGKGADEADDFVVLPAPAERDLRQWLALRPQLERPALFLSLSRRNYGQRLSRAAIRALVKERFQQAGIIGARKTTHSLRHSAISTAIRNGATPTQAQAMARHANVNTTMVYYHELERTTRPAEDLIIYRE